MFTQKLMGMIYFILIVYRLVWPDCSADEMRVFIFQKSRNPQWYSRTDICLAEKRVEFTRKRYSCTAYRAFLPINLAMRFYSGIVLLPSVCETLIDTYYWILMNVAYFC